MFEALISQVRSGRVKKKLFGTLSEAEQHLAREKDKLLNRTRKGEPCPASLGDYRMEVVFRAAPVVHQVPAARASVAA